MVRPVVIYDGIDPGVDVPKLSQRWLSLGRLILQPLGAARGKFQSVGDFQEYGFASKTIQEFHSLIHDGMFDSSISHAGDEMHSRIYEDASGIAGKDVILLWSTVSNPVRFLDLVTLYPQP